MRKKKAVQESPWHTICVTLDWKLIERLTNFAYEHDIARSAVVEYALVKLLGDGEGSTRLANRIKKEGFDRSTRRGRYAGEGASKKEIGAKSSLRKG